jgi:hypothetical protein
MSDPIAQLKHELLAAAERQHEQPAAARAGLRRWRLWGENRLLQATAAVAIVAAAVLFVASPWKSSPGFLERAEAALTPPAGTVLHIKWVEARSSEDASCTVTFAASEAWFDQDPPHRVRGIVTFLPDPADPSPCKSGPPVEGGGTRDTKESFIFVPPNTLQPSRGGYHGPIDPVTALRDALRDGRARNEGERQLGGRTVVRIRVDDPQAPCASFLAECDPVDWYVDPETFYPVQVVDPNGVAPGDVRFRSVLHYLTYEYLPGTAANRALADIRAQHPDAIER